MEKESGMERKLTLENAGRKMHPEKKADNSLAGRMRA